MLATANDALMSMWLVETQTSVHKSNETLVDVGKGEGAAFVETGGRSRRGGIQEAAADKGASGEKGGEVD